MDITVQKCLQNVEDSVTAADDLLDELEQGGDLTGFVERMHGVVDSLLTALDGLDDATVDDGDDPDDEEQDESTAEDWSPMLRKSRCSSSSTPANTPKPADSSSQSSTMLLEHAAASGSSVAKSSQPSTEPSAATTKYGIGRSTTSTGYGSMVHKSSGNHTTLTSSHNKSNKDNQEVTSKSSALPTDSKSATTASSQLHTDSENGKQNETSQQACSTEPPAAAAPNSLISQAWPMPKKLNKTTIVSKSSQGTLRSLAGRTQMPSTTSTATKSTASQELDTTTK